MLLLLSSLAFAGYGDAVGGLPSPAERELVLWTNAARVAPERFKDEYKAGGCSFDVDFTETERTAQDPVRWNPDLNEAARFHSVDMADNDWFNHSSSDGTPMNQRVARYYDHPASENIAWGYPDVYTAVFEGWMCSETGHRGNIMKPDWDELGTGIKGVYYTQNFGKAGIERHPVGVGMHFLSGNLVRFRAEVFDEGGVAPDRVDVVWNGEHGSMNLEYGVPARGVYLTSRDLAQALETEEPGCYEYYFEAAWGETTARFPETGSYGWGDCTFADGDAKWLARQLEPDEGGGCSSVGAPAGLVATFAGLLVLARRRRED